jgi:hypothetical protein
MTLDEFRRLTTDTAAPLHLPPLLLALWHDARGGWEAAHRIAQDVAGDDGAWVHAYLHRKEKDDANAGYWYRQARRPPSRASLDEEWGRSPPNC